MFIQNNRSFICIHCNKPVDKHVNSSRDHCPHCLYGLHIDIEPGDRKNKCLGVLSPTGIELKNDTVSILYRCQNCTEVRKNVSAPDDDADLILELSTQPLRYKKR